MSALKTIKAESQWGWYANAFPTAEQGSLRRDAVFFSETQRMGSAGQLPWEDTGAHCLFDSTF
jgi:hypothetical protein